MKIGIDARCLEWRRGGIARILVNVLKIWQKKSKHNFVLYFQNYVPDDNFLRHPNFELRLLKGPKFLRKHRIIAEQILMPSQLKKDNLDLFFATCYSAPLLLKSVKIVVAAWDISYSTHPKHYSWAHRTFLDFFSRKTCEISDGVITASSFDANQIIKHYKVRPQDISIVYLAADKRFTSEINKREVSRVTSKYKLPPKFILSMGVIQNRRNIDVLINSFKAINDEFNDFSLVVIGRNYTQPFIDIEAMLKEMVENKKAIYIPWVDDEDSSALYQAAHYYFCTSTVDGETIMLKEAMQSGTPVITSPLLKESIGGNGLIINDPESIADTSCILRIAMKDDLRRKELIKDGINWTQKISWNQVAEKIFTFLESR